MNWVYALMGHAIMSLDSHRDDAESECARNSGDTHTLYIRIGGVGRQSYQKVGVICSACYGIEFDEAWIFMNDQNHETIRRHVPVRRRR